jgi:hypothetical protein
MKYKIKFSYLLMAITALLLTGCGKEGPQGLQGPAGQDGNANVIASPWYTPTSWAGQTGDWYFDVSNSAITKDVVESGAILAYMSVPGDLYNNYTVRPLPAYAINAHWDFLLPNDGKSNYGAIEFTSDMVSRPGTSGYNFRFIIIPANYNLKSTLLKSTGDNDFKKMSYQQVCKLFGIQE